MTSEEEKGSGEIRKVLVLVEEWIEGEGEPQVFQIPQKGICLESRVLKDKREEGERRETNN